MNASTQRLVTMLLLAASSAGCSSLYYNEGANRMAVYNKASSSHSSSTSSAPDKFTGAYINIPPPSSPKSNDIDNINYVIIKKGDAFSVRLMSAYICDFHEFGIFDGMFGVSNQHSTKCPGGDGNQGSTTRGEIAIVTNIGERAGSTGLSYDPASTKKVGRLIYYNTDIRETGQLINAQNLPVFGPETYKGGPFFMDWTILELDNQENSNARELLGAMAGIGGTAFPSASPILGVLNSLGSTLLTGENDDVEMKYQMEFDPEFLGTADSYKNAADNKFSGKATSVYRLPLREGYFVIIRSERRDLIPSLNAKELKKQDEACRQSVESSANETGQKIDTAKCDTYNTPPLDICREEGFLCNHDGTPYRGATWMLLRIAREDASKAAVFDNTNSVADFLSAIEKNVRVIDGTAAQKAITDLINSKK